MTQFNSVISSFGIPMPTVTHHLFHNFDNSEPQNFFVTLMKSDCDILSEENRDKCAN